MKIGNKKEIRSRLKKCLIEYRLSGSSDSASSASHCFLALGKYKSAEILALLSLSLSRGENKHARIALGQAYQSLGFYVLAWHQFKKLVLTEFGAQAIQGMCEICAILKKYIFLEKFAALLLKKYPTAGDSNLYVAKLFIDLGEYRKAWIHLREVLCHLSGDSQAWKLAYQCSIGLEEYKVAVQIADKLVSMNPLCPQSYDMLGKAYHLNCQPEKSAEAYAKASELAPSNLAYFLNASNQVCRIAKNGNSAFLIASRLLKASTAMKQKAISGMSWDLVGSDSLLPYAFHAAYSPLNLKDVYAPYLEAMSSEYAKLLEGVIKASNEELQRLSTALPKYKSHTFSKESVITSKRKIRVGFLSRNFCAHSNTQAFIGYFRFMDRDRFEIIVIHRHETTVDADHLYVNSLADEVVYLDESLIYTHTLISRLCPDILFFTDIGMDPFDFLIPNMRICPIQISGWGLPHTTGLSSIDYYLSSGWLEKEEMQKEYVEKLVLLDGFPCSFPKDLLFFENTARDYFLLPTGELIFGCVQSLSKVHPDMDIILEAIAKDIPEAIFAFMCHTHSTLDHEFMERVQRRAPTAARRLLIMNRCIARDFLALCNNFDLMLDTPYYGAGVTAYLSAYVGTPTICFNGKRLRDSTFASIYRYLEISDPPIANSIPEYIECTIQLCRDPDKRRAIKAQMIDRAHKIYDNQTYIRSFEQFCQSLVDV